MSIYTYIISIKYNFFNLQMLGIWYVIRKTATTSTCLVYNFTATAEPNKYHLQQNSHLIIPGKFNYHYSGELTVPDPAVPANMRVKFSLNLASASYIVIMTDYYNYAAIFTCQSIAFGNRKSVSILSRKRTLDNVILEGIQNKLKSFSLNPKELSIISQEDCTKKEGGHDITITNDTFTAKNAAGLVRKAGEKLGDGIESAAAGAKKIYNRYNGDDSDSDDTAKEKTRFTAANTNPDAEWLP
ncbi:apolipoprotein d [Holotrichia oblita]|uniref:Apolipoprotein d n=1 Tax=Holotrichia oblita TaxID=644536 RepID=A0ACB9SHR2_HOLOL|nr:apolipoprotein d [Holotrichia oblita]